MRWSILIPCVQPSVKSQKVIQKSRNSHSTVSFSSPIFSSRSHILSNYAARQEMPLSASVHGIARKGCIYDFCGADKCEYASKFIISKTSGDIYMQHLLNLISGDIYMQHLLNLISGDIYMQHLLNLISGDIYMQHLLNLICHFKIKKIKLHTKIYLSQPKTSWLQFFIYYVCFTCC